MFGGIPTFVRTVCSPLCLMPGLDERDQLLEVVEIVVVADDALAVVGGAGRLVALEAVQEAPLAEPPGELGERTGLDLGEDSPATGLGALVTVGEPSCCGACPHLAGGGVRARPGVAAAASLALRAQAACEPAARDSQLPFQGAPP